MRASIVITGLVQGIFFRATAKEIAATHSIKGWIKNLSTGRVECTVEGLKTGVEEFVRWCHQGPKGAAVKDVKVEWKQYSGEFKEFVVIYP